MSQINIGKFWKKAITSSLQIIYWLKKKTWLIIYWYNNQL